MVLLIAIALSFLIFLTVNHFTWKAEAWPLQGLQPPAYQGHRGYWLDGAQENTLQSFRAAKARGLEMVELDVRLSKDKEVVVFHDENLKRLGGDSRKVSQVSTAELKSKFNIPTLLEVLRDEDVPRYFNIEIKSGSIFNAELEEAVTMIIRHNGMQERVLISSFNPFVIRRLSRLLPYVPRALLASEDKEPGNRYLLRKLLLAPYARAHALHLNYQDVSLEKLNLWKSRQIPVALWTVNDPELAQEYLDSGALSIITDKLGSKT